MNDVESSLNDGHASFHDISRSPPTTDTSLPRTQPSGTQTSQQSLLAPSFSEPNVTMPKMGPPQTTSVISNKSDHHSPGCQAHPIKSVEDKIRRLTPPQFLPLINQLLLQRLKGNMRPTRNSISNALKEYDEDVYKLAGVSRFGSYASQARRASLIELGGREGQGEQTWISLHPNLFKDETTTRSVPETTTGSVEGTTTESVEEATIESVENKIRRLTLPRFLPLINHLLLERSKGNMRPTRRSIANALKQYDEDVYKRAGVTNVKFGEYASQAQRASLIEFGGQESQGESAWIALHPNLFKEETTIEPVEDIAVEFVEETAIESIEDRIRRLTPPQFLPLIEQLLMARSKGIMKPGMFTIAFTLLQHDTDAYKRMGYDKDAYKRMGVSEFRDYASLAEQASLIELGGSEGDAWIALHPNLFKEETTTEPVEEIAVESVKETAIESVEETAIESVEDKIRRLTPPQFLPLIEQLLTARLKGIMKPGMYSIAFTLLQYDKDAYKRMGDKIRRLTPPQFLPLMEQLLMARSKGIMKPGMFAIAYTLLQYDGDVYKRMGVNKFRDYASLAEQASLIELGGSEGNAWMALHPIWFMEETNVPSPTPSTVRSNSSPAPQDNIEVLASTSFTPPPSTAPRTTTPHPNTPRMPYKPIPHVPLITCLSNIQQVGMAKPFRSTVGMILGSAAGVASMKEYFDLAVDDEILEIGEDDGYVWVRLHPNALSGKHFC
ncbi:hypothetical protein AZE42_12092 [Rhizopogon vesiculosus]|uniref:Uncharacterized protein n=1 Tax=Rhizopogon vesiculosus TaxID=180088 RepID=A0A1J8PQS4_9AGAM|nr:hypothetical protein AZE42_12092 [Rhizopogon vesiculosus]